MRTCGTKRQLIFGEGSRKERALRKQAVTAKPEKIVQPKFSIIVVDCDTHTPREAAKRGVESILSQTFRDFEIVFVHNGLKERRYEEEFDLSAVKKVKTLYLKELSNDWGNTSRNYGLMIADGEYILHFNIDNFLYPTCLEKVIQFL